MSPLLVMCLSDQQQTSHSKSACHTKHFIPTLFLPMIGGTCAMVDKTQFQPQNKSLERIKTFVVPSLKIMLCFINNSSSVLRGLCHPNKFYCSTSFLHVLLFSFSKCLVQCSVCPLHLKSKSSYMLTGERITTIQLQS